MMIILDANVHVGNAGINECEDEQDWGGKLLLSMIESEGLTLVNNLGLCNGVVTRVDPRNGTKSTTGVGPTKCRCPTKCYFPF